MVGGFSECIEKYFETIGDLAARGLSVWFLDWRGQGGSERPRRLPSRPRPRRFNRDAGELALFTRTLPEARRPRLVIGHSMGGAIALLCLRRHPDLFDAAILSAPMLAIRTGGMPTALVRSITGVARITGLGICFVPGAGAWQRDRVPSPERSRVSNDPERCRLQYAWFLGPRRAARRRADLGLARRRTPPRRAHRPERVSARDRHPDPARQRRIGDFRTPRVTSPCRPTATRLHPGRVPGFKARTLPRTRPDPQSLARSNRPLHYRARQPPQRLRTKPYGPTSRWDDT